MALALQPSPQTLSPRPPTAHRSRQRAEPTLMGLTHRQSGDSARRGRSPAIGDRRDPTAAAQGRLAGRERKAGGRFCPEAVTNHGSIGVVIVAALLTNDWSGRLST